MLHLPRWQTIAIIVFTVLAGIFALPNLLPERVLGVLPGWYAQNRINLGLDLRGGAHFLLEADLRGVLTERLTNLSDTLRAELRKNQVAFKDVAVEQGNRVVITLRDEAQRAKAIEAVRAVDPTLMVAPGIGDTIQVSYSEPDLFRRKKEVIDQSIEILRRRVDETGTIEPTIVREGDDRILLQVPGIKDTTDLKRKINQTAKLTFHLVNEDVATQGGMPATVPPNTFLVPTREGVQELRRANPKAAEEINAANPKPGPEQICRRYQPQCIPVLKRVVVGGEDLDDAKATFDQQQGSRPIISFTFNGAGGRAFCTATRANIG